MALDATVGGTSSNSYVTLAAAESYFLGRLSVDDWDAADEHEREAALIMATARLDVEPYVGAPVSYLQRLAWPRYGAYTRNGAALSTTAIPQQVQDATCELALAILTDPEIVSGASGLAEFQNLRLGSLDVTPRAASSSALPANIIRLLMPLRVGGFQNRVVRA